MYVTCENNHYDCAEVLLANGAKIEGKESEMPNPLLICAKGGNVKLLKLLLKYGGDVFTSTASGATIFHVAARVGKADIIEYAYKHMVSLVECEQDNNQRVELKSKIKKFLNKKDGIMNNTAYLTACQKGSISTIKTLVFVCHADVTITDNFDRFGSDCSTMGYYPQLKQQLVKLERGDAAEK